MTEDEHAFFQASLEFCEIWTKDMRNIQNTKEAMDKLAKARGKLYQTYKRLKKGER